MNEKKKPILGQEAVTDARTLGTPRMLILGLQHLFAMVGATVLVPILVQGYGLPLSIQTTLLMAGLGTLLFHLITKKKVPAFLGSSFAYLGGFSIVAPMLADADGSLPVANTKMLPYACAAIAFSGLVYLAASVLISTFGIRRIMKFFPPVVTGPIIISIGLILAAGLDGIARDLPVPAPTDANVYDMTADERAAAGIHSLPKSLEEATKLFAASPFMKEVLGDHVFNKYLEAKREEWSSYRARVSQWEIDSYLVKY